VKGTRTLAFAGLAAFAAACGRPAAAPEGAPPSVRVAKVQTGTLSEWVRLSGRVVPPPDRDATLAPRVEGVLAEVTARLGERVPRGRILARVDTAALDDALSAAAAAERSASAEADSKKAIATRTRALLARGVVSGEQAESDDAAAAAADAALAQARAAEAQAARRRGWAGLAAPFDGIVVRVLRHAGEPVDGTPATPVVEVAAEHPVEIAVDAPAAALQRLSPGQSAAIMLDASDRSPIAARVASVAAALDAATGAGPVRLHPDAEDARLVLGRVVEARIAVAHHDDAVFVPASALRGGASGTVEVVVVPDHHARVRVVKIGLRDGDRVEILAGLVPGDAVVVDDPVGLADGVRVQDGM